jgi:hypothetical protein
MKYSKKQAPTYLVLAKMKERTESPKVLSGSEAKPPAPKKFFRAAVLLSPKEVAASQQTEDGEPGRKGQARSNPNSIAGPINTYGQRPIYTFTTIDINCQSTIINGLFQSGIKILRGLVVCP